MFNMLNMEVGTGKNPPWMCKILVTLTVFSYFFRLARRMPLYLLERMGLRNYALQRIGLRIALPLRRPARMHFRTGKD
jgi:hypothetical protein